MGGWGKEAYGIKTRPMLSKGGQDSHTAGGKTEKAKVIALSHDKGLGDRGA